jgi:hypothetical protein
MEKHEPLISRADLGRRWKCSSHTLFRREKEGILTPIRLGKLIRYSLIEIQALEAKSRKEPC